MKKCEFCNRLTAIVVVLCLFFGILCCGGVAFGEEVGSVAKYSGEVAHLFTHCLIANPDIAFADGNSMGMHYDRDCLLPSEFGRILQELYSRGYALVDIHKTYQMKNGRAVRVAFDFPVGKKPLILSFDDVVYDSKKQGMGMADRLVVKDGKVGAETFSRSPDCLSANESDVQFDNEFIGILESFIANHPDFSYQNARGMICLTGFSGILGYRTQAGSENRSSEVEKAKVVVEKLKSDGWQFACHSYGHGHMKKKTPQQISGDVAKWKEEVGSIVGDTNLYVYPYGEWLVAKAGGEGLDERHEALLSAGFNVFFSVGIRPFFSYLPFGCENGYLFMDRCPMDGVTLRCGNEGVEKYFNPKAVYDEDLRKIHFPKQLL